MESRMPLLLPLLLFFLPNRSECDPGGRDPCKTTDDGFGLTCSNISSEFFTSAMFFSLDDDIARFTGEMKRLEIHQSNVTVLRSGSFKRMPLLSYLIVSNVSLRRIDRGAFEGLTMLKMADFSHNPLEEIPVDAFKDSRISHLNLVGNSALYVPTNGPFLNAKRLRSLLLKGCRIRHLPGSAFSGVVDLSYLDLSENMLEMLPQDVFSPLRHLDFLDLSRNRFRTVNFAVFTSIPSYPSGPGTVILAGNRWLCNCNISELIDWSTKQEGDGTSSVSLTRLRIRTECYEPKDMRRTSWNDVQRLKLLSSC